MVPPLESTNRQQTPKLGTKAINRKCICGTHDLHYLAAQLPEAVPPLSEHSVEVKQVPFRRRELRASDDNNKKSVPVQSRMRGRKMPVSVRSPGNTGLTPR